MAEIHIWLQLENRYWDVCPNNVDRMHDQTVEERDGLSPIDLLIVSPETGVSRLQKMYHPMGIFDQGSKVWTKVEEALIIRRYTENWEAPADQKVNPWDLNEPDPTDNGTMGTIPGATLECNVGDRLVIHFRNKDFRQGLGAKTRAHSLHPHGIVFHPKYDGAFPLSPPDPDQPIPATEAAAWASVDVTGSFKQGDRVPPGGTFTYVWDTFGWPSTAGVWHYHDHSICDAENVLLGALGFLVIHNPNDPDDVIDSDMPSGALNAPLFNTRCFPIRDPFPILDLDLRKVQKIEIKDTQLDISKKLDKKKIPLFDELVRMRVEEVKKQEKSKSRASAVMPKELFLFERGDSIFEIDPGKLQVLRFCWRVYKAPPKKAQYLQYYHELPGAGMMINGRKYLGNTPTLIAGPDTKMRFGLAAMNNNTFHTFHIHGHRWIMPGPQGNNPGQIQSSPQVISVSQFEDTRIFGPANSFSFTIQQGQSSFMGARFEPDPNRAPGIGEWHMHCHVLGHMMPGGMMGSLLVINGGEFFSKLPVGTLCHEEKDEPVENTILVDNFAFSPSVLVVSSGSSITFDFREADHTVSTVSTTGAASSIEINNGGGPGDAIAPLPQQISVIVNGNPGDEIDYICGIHGAGMSGKIVIS